MKNTSRSWVFGLSLLILSLPVFSASSIEVFKTELSTSNDQVSAILSSNIDGRHLSRFEAVILIDAYIASQTSEIEVDDFMLTFADVDSDVSYVNSLKRLSYFRGDNTEGTPVTKENQLFRPLDKVSRQEFVKMVLEASDIPLMLGEQNITPFYDSNDVVGFWKKYFNTAVDNGLIVGNGNYLYPTNSLLINEAFIILNRLDNIFTPTSMGYKESGFEDAGLDVDSLIEKSIGFISDNSYYATGGVPISIDDMEQLQLSPTELVSFCDSSTNVTVLKAATSQSSSSDVFVQYDWDSSSGYFKSINGSTSDEEVCFYPANNNQLFDYQVSLTVSDSIGHIDSAQMNVAYSNFVFDVSNSNHDLSSDFNLSALSVAGVMKAGEPFDINLAASSISRSGLDLGLENIIVSLISNDGNRVTVYSGGVVNNFCFIQCSCYSKLLQYHCYT